MRLVDVLVSFLKVVMCGCCVVWREMSKNVSADTSQNIDVEHDSSLKFNKIVFNFDRSERFIGKIVMIFYDLCLLHLFMMCLVLLLILPTKSNFTIHQQKQFQFQILPTKTISNANFNFTGWPICRNWFDHIGLLLCRTSKSFMPVTLCTRVECIWHNQSKFIHEIVPFARSGIKKNQTRHDIKYNLNIIDSADSTKVTHQLVQSTTQFTSLVLQACHLSHLDKTHLRTDLKSEIIILVNNFIR